ncbi:globin [Nannocystis pusilla]|uniref:globin domain-containing protein n=1 Tax=Nannocystis pusilla TaxID=889268 RepID=UPI003DA618FF
MTGDAGCARGTLTAMSELAPEDEIYARIGEEGFARLVAAFYRRVSDDDILGPMYPRHDMVGAEARLRDFLVGRFGGPQRYIAQRGHPRLRARHMPFKLDLRARDRWVALMEAALVEARLEPGAAATLRGFFADTATFLMNSG